ncbi:MAG TPA: hypothetical protein PKZ78_05715, partial [Candidatus Goldiibacteriota bacterium]|nr:hypothetical protein [Candidatus Goldiibacteriota bacterium]
MVRKSNKNEFKAFFLRALFAPPYFIKKIEIRKNDIVLSGLFKTYSLRSNKVAVRSYKDAFGGPAYTYVIQFDKKRFVFDAFYFKGTWTNVLSKSVKISYNGSYNPGNRLLLGLSFAV